MSNPRATPAARDVAPSRLASRHRLRGYIARMNVLEAAASRFVKAGESGDCGHERKGGEFSRGNSCAAGSGSSINQVWNDFSNKQKFKKGSFGSQWLGDLTKDAMRGDFSSINSAVEALQDKDSRSAVAKRGVDPDAAADYLNGLKAASRGNRPDSSARPTTAPFHEQAISSAARVPANKRFGDNKVFIHHAWEEHQKDPSHPRMTLQEFKNELMENRGEIPLSRADLVQAMNPRDVEQSDTQLWLRPKTPYGSPSASWNFIRMPSRYRGVPQTTRLARAGSPEDCGHVPAGHPKAGQFDHKNWCASLRGRPRGEHPASRRSARPSPSSGQPGLR